MQECTGEYKLPIHSDHVGIDFANRQFSVGSSCCDDVIIYSNKGEDTCQIERLVVIANRAARKPEVVKAVAKVAAAAVRVAKAVKAEARVEAAAVKVAAIANSIQL
jgi:hypothetical protein